MYSNFIMDEKFIIKFDNIPGGATEKYAFPLGESMLSVAPPPRVTAYADNTVFPKELYDPYKTYITLAFPQQTWRKVCKDYGPPPIYQIEKVIKTFEEIFSKNKLFLEFYFNLELNSNSDFIHLHGVIVNKKNLNQLIKFKKLIREYFDIPSTNRVAIKIYSQSKIRSEEDQLNYHLKSIGYDGSIKNRLKTNFYSVRSDEANVGEKIQNEIQE